MTMPWMRTHRIAVAVSIGLAACAAPPVELNAVLVDPSPLVRAELAGFVSRALNGAPVRLADEALTTAPVLTIDHVQPRDEQGRPLNGRELGRAEKFRLIRSHKRCVLVHERTGQRFFFSAADCSVR
jgi:hypothetical protein